MEKVTHRQQMTKNDFLDLRNIFYYESRQRIRVWHQHKNNALSFQM